MDSNSGMAPDTWIERVKMEIDDTYARLNGEYEGEMLLRF